MLQCHYTRCTGRKSRAIVHAVPTRIIYTVLLERVQQERLKKDPAGLKRPTV